MTHNKGSSGFAIAWDQDRSGRKRQKKKLVSEAHQVRVWRGLRAAAKLSPLQPITVYVAHFAHRFLFFCCFTLFFAS